VEEVLVEDRVAAATPEMAWLYCMIKSPCMGRP
jgi:hypothetical protein